MGTNIAVTTESFQPGKKDWIKNRKGLKTMRTITVVPSLFSADHIVNGAIPSGTVLALVTTGPNTGWYGPYEGGQGSVNEVASIAVDATGGTWQVAFDGETTTAQAFNVSAANLLTAINNLSNVSPGDVTVTGGPGSAGGATPYVITFVGARYADINVPNVTTVTALTGGATTAVVTTNPAGGGASPATDGRQEPKGHLFEDLKVTALATDPKVGSALFWEGIVDKSKLPNFASTADGKGELDAYAEGVLSKFIRYE